MPKLLTEKQRKAFHKAFAKRVKETRDEIHIISRGNRWAVYKSRAKRALRLFEHRELAFLYACEIGGKIIVHNKNAEVLFIYEKT